MQHHLYCAGISKNISKKSSNFALDFGRVHFCVRAIVKFFKRKGEDHPFDKK